VETKIKLIIFIAVFVGLFGCAPVSPARFSNDTSQAPGSLRDSTIPSFELPANAPQEPAPAAAAKADSPALASAKAPTSDPEIVVTAQRLPLNKLPVPAWAATPQSETWTKMTLKAIEDLGSTLIQTEIQDAQDFCPAYKKLLTPEREKVWLQLISSMAKFESGFDPISAFTENFRGSDSKLIVSRGLLQISKGSANLYGCQIETEKQLEDPETNLRCGVRIISSLVTKYHSIHGFQTTSETSNSSNPWMGLARYWSVLRRKAKDLLIRSSVRQLPICQASAGLNRPHLMDR
jgi:hypothetical protein